MKNYETEANASNTDAYREHEQKTKNYIKEKWAEVNEKLMTMFAEFATCKQSGAYAYSNEARHLSPSSRHTLTANYYTCTFEILAGLGKMYVADE